MPIPQYAFSWLQRPDACFCCLDHSFTVPRSNGMTSSVLLPNHGKKTRDKDLRLTRKKCVLHEGSIPSPSKQQTLSYLLPQTSLVKKLLVCCHDDDSVLYGSGRFDLGAQRGVSVANPLQKQTTTIVYKHRHHNYKALGSRRQQQGQGRHEGCGAISQCRN